MKPYIWAFACLLASGCHFSVTGFSADASPPMVTRDLGIDLAATNLSLGSACAAATQCASGVCSGGICCDMACDGLCYACNLPGLVGHCSLAPAGTDSGGKCAAAAAATCGLDGKCDGAGQCEKWPAGTLCGSPTCASGMATYAPACDGKGTCAATPSFACDPYACNGTACYTTCTDDTQCASGQSCDKGSCGKRASGQPCTTKDDCESDECQQGVCCDSQCDGTCMACNLSGSVGTCTNVPAGQDPLDQCAPDSQASCGKDGQCDGKGGCEKWASGTVCANAMCTPNNQSSNAARTCDGAGTCQPAKVTACGNYLCSDTYNGGQCFTYCIIDAACSQGHHCVFGSCK